VLAAALLAVVLFRGAIVRGLTALVLGAATRTRVGIGELDVSPRRIVARDLTLARGADPLFSAERIDVRYDLRQLLFGGGRRYGLASVSVERPHLTLARRADGSFNLAAAPAGGAAGPGPSGGAGDPLRFRLAIRDGSIAVDDPYRALPVARRLSLDGIALAADVDSASRTVYRGSGRVADDAGQPVAFAGRIDADGFALHRLRARNLDLPPIVDYFINTPSAALYRGRAPSVDVRAYAFPARTGATYHLTGSADVTGGAMRVPGLAVPATGMHGRLDAFDGGLVSPRLDARLGTARAQLAGGLFGWRSPVFRLGIVSSTDLAAARHLFRFADRLPLHGAATLSTFLEGPVGGLVAATRVTGAAIGYGRFPVTNASGRAIFDAGADAVDIVGVHGSYGGLAVAADGAVALGAAAPVTALVLDAVGPAAGIPYAGQLAPRAILHATALVAGPGLRLDARGAGEGSGGGTRLRGLFHIDPNGDGSFGPLAARRDDGARLDGTFYSERSHDRSGFWLDAADYPFADLGTGPQLPGLGLIAPVFSGRLNGAVAGVGPPSAFRLAGRVRLRSARIANVTIDDASGLVAGAFGNLRLGGATARGPWGSFRGEGAYAGGRLALTGSYAGSFERLRNLTGDLGGSGAVAGPVALLIDPVRTVVQSLGARSGDARIRGVAVDRLAGTLSVSGRDLRVYAATAQVAGGTFAAAGDPQRGGGAGVSLAGADLATMRSGPVRSGLLAAIGAVRGSAGTSRFAGGLAVGGITLDRVPLAANGDLAFGGTSASFARTDALADGAAGSLAGTVDGLGAPAPRFDVGVHVSSAALGPVAHLLLPGRRGIAGTLGGDVRLRGTFARLRLDGTVRLPEGTVNGLNFAAAGARVGIDRRGIRASDGRVTVGSTRTEFAGFYGADESDFRVRSPRADLADFNDFFDAGDTLGGRGRVAVRLTEGRGRPTRSDAAIAIAGLRYRRFDLGDARAAWRSSGPNVTGAVDFGGASGRLDAAGVLVLPEHALLPALLLRSRFDGHAELQGLDLGVWLPALGIAAPIGGRLDATATIVGPLRDPAVSAVATLADGSVGKFPVDRLSLEVSSTFDRTTLKRVEVDLPSIALVGSGQFGLGERAPLALALHAESPNLGALSSRFFGAAYPLTGQASADLTIDGTRASPRVAGSVDVRAATIRGVAISGASAAFSLRGRELVLRNAVARLAAGNVTLDGSVPLPAGPYSRGPAASRVGLAFAANDVELTDFAPLLPAGSQLRGRLDGAVSVSGTAGAPRLAGRVILAGGSLLTPFETVPLSDVGAVLRFDGDAARLESLHAAAGGGQVDASGSLRLADLVDPAADVAYDFVAYADKLRLDLPAYGSGTIDGTLGLRRGAAGPASLAGDLRLSDGTIPFSALLFAGAGGGGFNATTVAAPNRPPGADVAFNLDVSAERNVRVRSANVDIGARGDLHVDGTLGTPSLAGGFTSTGGTITYFNTVFRLIDGTVTFTPELGLIPTLDARAITHVINPDPNTVRNSAGTADVTLTLAGPVNNLTIGLTSEPAYERQQILGLLLNAPALGASNLFGENRYQATPYGSNATAGLPPGVVAFRTQTGELSVAQEAFGVANAQFTRTLLAPIETTFANAVGLSNFNVNVDYTGNVGVSARKVLGKKVNAVYGSTFGYPYRQTFGFEFKPSEVTAAQVTVFESLGVSGLNSLTPTEFITNTSNAKIGAAQPSGGTTGFSLSLQHAF